MHYLQMPRLSGTTVGYFMRNNVCQYYGMVCSPLRASALFSTRCLFCRHKNMSQVTEQLEPQYYASSYQSPDGAWHQKTLKNMLSLEPCPPTIDCNYRSVKPHHCVDVPGLSAWLQADTVQGMPQTPAGAAASVCKTSVDLLSNKPV